MLEMLIKPKRAERKSWELFFIGLVYASVALLLVTFVFGKDSVLREGSGLLIVIFTVIMCMPFVYYLIKLEEGKDVEISKSGKLLKEHSKAIKALMWMFLGFVVAFSFWYLVLPGYAANNFNFQIKVFCAINSPSNFDYCLQQNGISILTGDVTKTRLIMNIFFHYCFIALCYFFY